MKTLLTQLAKMPRAAAQALPDLLVYIARVARASRRAFLQIAFAVAACHMLVSSL